MLFLAEDDDATFGMYWMYDGSGNTMELFGKNSSTINGPHMLIQRDAGNVAIGDDFASGHRLSVDGKIACEELRVELSGAWPDYVFTEQHELMPLTELEQYIENHQHLPGIPAATELETTGLEVGEMQRMMMEKIEELTLYILELDREMEQLRMANEELTNQIANTQKR